MARVLDELIVKLSTRASFAGLDRFNRRLDMLASRGHAVGNALLALGTAMTAATIAPAKMAADFEEALAKMQALVGVPTDVLARYSAELIQMSNDTTVPVLQLADALFQIESAGYRDADALAILDATARASAAGLGEQKDIAKAVTDALFNYGLEADQAADATDALLTAVRLGKMEPDELAAALDKVAPAAKTAGIEFDHLLAMMAGLSKAGTSPREAATQLRQLINELNSMQPGSPAAQALAEVGLSVGEVQAALADPSHGLYGALMTINTALGDNRRGWYEIIGSQEAAGAALVLTGDSTAEVAEIVRGLGERAGATDTAFEIMAETAKFKLSDAWNTLKNILLVISLHTLPYVKMWLDRIVAVLDDVADMSAGAQAALATLFAVGPALLAFGVGVKGAAFALSGVTAAINGIMAVLPLLRAAMAAALGPIGLIMLGLYLAWEPISTFFAGLWEGLKSGAAEIGAAFSALGESLGPVATVFRSIGDLFSWVRGLFAADNTDLGRSLGAAIAGDVALAIDNLRIVSDIIAGIFGWIGDVRQGFADLFDVQIMKQSWEAVKEWFATISLLQMGRDLIDTLAFGIGQMKDRIIESIKGIFGGLAEYLPFSDARKGPLSRLTASGRAIIETLAEGMRQAGDFGPQLEAALAIDPFRAAAPIPAAAGGNVNVTMAFSENAIQVRVDGGDPQALVDALQNRLALELRAGVEQADSRYLA